MLAAAPPRSLAPRAVDRLVGHLRRAGTVLITPGPWPGAHLRLDVTARHWSGVQDGWGQLERRRVRVESSGRGSAARPRSAELWLPDATGTVAAATKPTALAETSNSGGTAAVAG
ncbi:hypothetical protein ACFU7Y_37405 [Kitasatospora sp. NPDC057542]|uniref:hypothetical protein n=1 Tax=Streptomycetaceae TaxID=2062 RepID=UPI001CC944CC|nr:hypothetical protein [Streptomyces sp. LS1784]